jgi:hypothetical protein
MRGTFFAGWASAARLAADRSVQRRTRQIVVIALPRRRTRLVAMPRGHRQPFFAAC